MRKWFKFRLSRRKLTILWVVLVIGISIQLMIVAPRVVDDEAKVQEPAAVTLDGEADPNEADQTMSSIHMVETKEGAKDWELWSDEAKSIASKDIVLLKGVKSLFHGKDGTVFTVTGRRGQINVPRKDLEISGEVQTKTSNGYTFFSDDMKYISKTRILETASAVKVVGPPQEGKRALLLNGKGMRTNVADSNIEVLSQVRAEKVLDDGRRAVIRSHKAHFDSESSAASFEGEVVLDVDDMRITGPKADFFYDTTKDILKSVTFTGGARVSDPTKWATSQKVKVDFEQNKYILNGNPRVVQNNDELRGQEIIFHDGGKRVQVISAKARLDKNRLEDKNE